jgi:hypothetical protein
MMSNHFVGSAGAPVFGASHGAQSVSGHAAIRWLCGMVLALTLPSSPAYSVDVRMQCPRIDSGEFFFPRGTLNQQRPDSDSFRRYWYSDHLKAMGEPSLSCGRSPDHADSYRFLWLRTFSHPVTVRVDQTTDGAKVTWVELSGAGGYEPGVVYTRVEKQITLDQWQQLVSALDSIDFWNMPTNPLRPVHGFDGQRWILEGSQAGRYHIVDRWSPKSGRYKEACEMFLRLFRAATTTAQ